MILQTQIFCLIAIRLTYYTFVCICWFNFKSIIANEKLTDSSYGSEDETYKEYLP